MIILNKAQIQGKISRMAMEIYEKHAQAEQIILAGINNKGYRLAGLLKAKLDEISSFKVLLCRVTLNPAAPLESEAEIDIPATQIKNKIVVIIDDVGNTGRTIFYAFKPFMRQLPKGVEVALLIERMHKAYPVFANYVGLQLATTTKENIEVMIEDGSDWRTELN